MIDSFSNLHLALRSLSRNRRFALLAVVTLSLGLGIATAFFSVFDTILLRPLAYGDAEELVIMLEPRRSPTSPANFLDVKAAAASLSDLTAATPWAPVLRGEGTAEQIPGLWSTLDLFRLLKVEPALGRVYGPQDDSRRVVVLSHELWQQRFGGDEAILERSLELDGDPHRVIGVMPPGFAFPPFWATDARFWAPFSDPHGWDHRGSSFLRVFGRLADGHDVSSAQAEVDVLAQQLAQSHPEFNADLVYRVEPLSEPVVEDIRPALRTLLFGVGLVLLIACANVASLWLTHASGRRQELAIRRALGGRGWTLWRMGLAESLWIVATAVGVGWLFASWGLEAIRMSAPPDVPRVAEMALDGRTFAFTAGVGALLCLVFSSVLPLAGSFGRTRAWTGGSRRTSGPGESRARSMLATAEIAMALVLLLASGLMAKSLMNLWRVDSGLQSEGILTAKLPFGGSGVEAREDQNPFFDRLLAEVNSLPGVRSAALINHLHLGGDIWTQGFEIEGQPVTNSADAPHASFKVVSEGLFETFGIPLLEGRTFEREDSAEGRPVVVVSERLASVAWPGESAVGKRIRRLREDAEWIEVVGVVADVRQWSLTDEPRPEIYYPYRQNPAYNWTQTSLVVATSGDPEDWVPTVAESLRGMTPQVPFVHPRSLPQIYGELLWQPRFSASLLAVFALAAMALAAVGVYGAMSFAAGSRRRELGVRAALGADRRQLVRLLMGQGIASTCVGIGVGLLVALALGRWLESQLHGVSPHDPLTVGISAAGVALVAAVAAYLPALRASRADPVESLRREE
ncbi:MAG: ABC transporter permease [Acidobacteriota bacterium]